MNDLSRRQLLSRGVVFGGGLAAALYLPRPRALAAAAASDTPEIFSAEEWASVEAITSRLIPADHEPGAVEAGCVNFIDKALANEDAAMKPVYDAGLPAVDAASRKRFEKPFVVLTGEQQDTLLAELEDGLAQGWPADAVPSPVFFETVRAHTTMAFLADPKYGGNHDYAGWKLVGYPGPSHHTGGYTPAQMLGTARIKAVWGEEI